jgi:hypothetical protein
MKCSYIFILLVTIAFNKLHAQTKEQQKIVERILTDQKRWQQSRLPTYLVHNKNNSWQVPFPGQRYYMGGGLLGYPLNAVPKPVKTYITYSPGKTRPIVRDSVNGIRSYVRFK